MRPIVDGTPASVIRREESGPDNESNSTPRLLAMAVGLVGDPEKVRQRMECTPEEFAQYRAGTRELNNREFGLLVDLIINEQRALIEKHREVMAQVRKQNQALRRLTDE